MLKKYTLYLLISLLCFSLEVPIEELKKYKKITVYEKTFIYLSLDGFKIGDKINIQLKFDNGYYYDELPLGRYQSDTYTQSDFDNLVYYKSWSYSVSGTSHTFDFSIKLTKNSKYLLLGTPYFTDKPNTKLTVKHTHFNIVTIIIIVAVIIVALIIGLLVYRYIKRKRDFIAGPSNLQQPYQAPGYIPPSQPYYQTAPLY